MSRFQVIGEPQLVGFDNGSPRVRVRFRWANGPRRQRTVTIGNLLGNGDSNAKLAKNGNGAQLVETVGLSLAPFNQSGIGNVCPHASAGCASACLDETGLGYIWPMIHVARVAKTVAYYRARRWFINQLGAEVENAQRRADRSGALLAIRLNVFSDIPWEKTAPSLFADFPRAEFYDYTKDPRRVGALRPNYWTTFSRSETNGETSRQLLAEGKNVAVVFDPGFRSTGLSKGFANYQLPKTWYGSPVINGDLTDLRFADQRGRRRGRVVGLKLKSVSDAQRLGAVASGFAYRHKIGV